MFDSKPVVLFLDGHGSHLSYSTAKLAKDNNIIFMCLPPNTSFALQPLDVGFFKPAKQLWKAILRHWYRELRLLKVDKCIFPMLLGRLWKGLKGQNLPNGFRGAGLYSLNIDQPSKMIITQEVSETCNSPSSSVKFLRSAILSVLAPEKSADTIDAIENARRGHTAANSYSSG